MGPGLETREWGVEMPITVVSLGTTPYISSKVSWSGGVTASGSPNPANNPVIYRGEHIHFPAIKVKVASALTAPTLAIAQTQIGGPYDVNGDSYFLPYDNDKITSMRLPSPPPVGITLFWTANLSGCRFFVDTINGSTDLMVYHANTHQFGATPLQDADAQSGNASNVLTTMLANARLDLAPLALAGAAACTKATYFGPAGNLERLLKFRGFENESANPLNRPRDKPTFGGGCTIVGLPVGGAWQFWYQCWGKVNYREKDTVVRRKIIPDKRVTGAVHQMAEGVLGKGQIY
jgi:hypothetical protein